MPTILDPDESHFSVEAKHLKWPVFVPRKLSAKRVYQQDQFKLFEEQNKIKTDDADSTLTLWGYKYQKLDSHVVFYHLETNILNVPKSNRLCAG